MRLGALLVLAFLAAGCLSRFPGANVRDVSYHALKIDTRLGSFTAILFENETPATSAFIMKLVQAKYYDGRQFGRTIPGFVIQEVDRTGGTTDQREHVKLEAPTAVAFSAGAFGIARDSDPDSGGSEFFVMDHPTSTLYGNYTAFAQVVDGLDVVHKIARAAAVNTGPASAVGSPPGSPVYFGVHDRVPVDPIVMTSVTLVDVTLPADVARHYPLRVGNSTRTDTVRATLEWPADLRAGVASALAWYAWPRDTSAQGQAQDPAPIDLSGATVVVGNATLPVTADVPNGVARFSWTPLSSGTWTLHLVRGGSELAAADVDVLT